MKVCPERQIRLAVFICFFVLVNAGISHAQKLRVAYTAFAGTFTILWLGHDAGLYQKHGADMELLFIGSSTTAVQALLGGDVDIVYSAAGAYSRKEALRKAEEFAQYGVSWFEEPVSSDDLGGLRLLRDRAPECMEIAAGEYGMICIIFAACSKQERLTFCKRMRPAVVVTPGFLLWQPFARRTRCLCPPTRRRHSTRMFAAR